MSINFYSLPSDINRLIADQLPNAEDRLNFRTANKEIFSTVPPLSLQEHRMLHKVKIVDFSPNKDTELWFELVILNRKPENKTEYIKQIAWKIQHNIFWILISTSLLTELPISAAVTYLAYNYNTNLVSLALIAFIMRYGYSLLLRYLDPFFSLLYFTNHKKPIAEQLAKLEDNELLALHMSNKDCYLLTRVNVKYRDFKYRKILEQEYLQFQKKQLFPLRLSASATLR